MGDVHRLPDVKRDDDLRLVDMTWGELRSRMAEERRRTGPSETPPLKPKEFAKLMRVAEDRVQDWCEQGMPYIPTGDERGKRIRPSRAFEWLEKNRG